MSKPDAREDWAIRFISMNDQPLTNHIVAARQATASTETPAQILSMLKKLEKQGWLSSVKSGRELRWSATAAGEKVMA